MTAVPQLVPSPHVPWPVLVRRGARPPAFDQRIGLDYLRALEARKLSPETVRSVRSSLRVLAEFVGKPLEETTPADLADWQADRASKVVARSLRKETSQVRCFFEWAAAEERIPGSPAIRLHVPKVPRLLPRPIPEQRLASALASADRKMAAVLGLAAFAGLRACEIAALVWADVTLGDAEPTLRVVGKGGVERMLDVSPDLAELLDALPSGRRGPVIRRGDDGHGHNTANRISKAANKHLRAQGIPDTLHSLRHRCLTEVCREGGVRIAQEVAGHASISTTAPYTKVARRDARPVLLAVGRLRLDEAGGTR